MKINILYEDNYIIVCEKPVGIPSQSDKTSDYDMVNRLKNYIHETTDVNGEPYIGIVHRLDRPVGGIMVFAKTPFAAKSLSEQIRLDKVHKKYLAVVTADLSKKVGKEYSLTDFLVKDGRTNLSKVTSKRDANGKKAELTYKILETAECKTQKDEEEMMKASLVEVTLITGRHHQIRVQMSNAKLGLWGDTKYNPKYKDYKGWINVALYSYQLRFTHPKTGKEMEFQKYPLENPFCNFSFIKNLL
ncbi:RluA family pseudouridine synthase [Anaeromicropila herbilytica]|uniref:RNA pseudouridylate synthase n=1 Tax=Anaeromicropila herbilytica TaxID=2785025 RepID=A0A7R7ICA9_9FIRM|nr:RluA family pseudouridine synthase [Anaeromicropila herbilytica]BCN28763.1 RNA pseudouridine synthase [Anaeromicropila herbilytica]